MTAAAQRRLRRLRFVTARYESLQGLRLVQTGLMWLLLALWAGVLFSPAGMDPDINAAVVVPATVLFVVAEVASFVLDRRMKEYEAAYEQQTTGD